MHGQTYWYPLSPRCGLFDEGDLGIGQAVQFVDELIELPIHSSNLRWRHRRLVRRPAAAR